MSYFQDYLYQPYQCDPDACRPSVGVYIKKGYSSMVQADASKLGTDSEKTIREVKVGFVADEQTIPNTLKAQVGFGAQSGCLEWVDVGSFDLACLTNRSDAQHKSANSRANLEAGFSAMRRGNFLAWRFWVDVAAGKTEITGGAACFNKVSLSVRVPEVRPR